MKKGSVVFFLLLHTLCFSIALTERYELAKSNARAYKRPLILLFTGSDWSAESQKMSALIASNKAQEVLKNDVIFCQIDFPEINRQTEKELQANTQLKEKYAISQLPSLVLLDEQQAYVTTVGFVPVPPETFAKYIRERYELYGKLQKAVARITDQSTESLQQLLIDAKELQNQEYIALVVKEGIHRNQNGIFMLEKYAQLVAAGFGETAEAVALRKDIKEKREELSIDARLQSALLAFEEARKGGNVEKVLAPLEQVLKDVPADHTQLWRIQFHVAKYLQENNCKERASQYAKEAKKEAPKAFHKQLETLISESALD